MIEDKDRLRKQGENALKLFQTRFTVNIAIEKILKKFVA